MNACGWVPGSVPRGFGTFEADARVVRMQLDLTAPSPTLSAPVFATYEIRMFSYFAQWARDNLAALLQERRRWKS